MGSDGRGFEAANEFGVIECDPIYIAFRAVEKKVESSGIRHKIIKLEDTIHPRPLSWPVPLIEIAGNKADFRRHWEKINYVFDLPDPALVPELELSGHERALLKRFAATCRQLSSYSAFADRGGSLKIVMEDGQWSVHPDLPRHESFSGLSATFRQLHNDGEEASYRKVYSILGKASGRLPNDVSLSSRGVLKKWNSARQSLNQSMLETLVCEKVLGSADRKGQKVTMEGIRPDELIKTFNYGDSLHWGKEKERLAELTADPAQEAFHRFFVTDAMITLGHFYFGFSVVASSALGDGARGGLTSDGAAPPGAPSSP